MERRNEVVHNVWTFTRDGRIHGWRLARPGKRDQPARQGSRASRWLHTVLPVETGLSPICDGCLMHGLSYSTDSRTYEKNQSGSRVSPG